MFSVKLGRLSSSRVLSGYFSILVILFHLLSPLTSFADQAQYFYDELGRLVGVIDGQGNIASYEYDSVGNLLSISRSPVAAPSVISVTPDPIEAGTTIPITISGTDLLLSTVTTSNPDIQVGVVTTNTETLVETTLRIPNPTTFGATTLTVTVPGGSTGAPLTINQPVPTIAQLAATVLPPGATVTMTGTGFGTVSGSNHVTFPGASGTRLLATVLSESLTSVTVQVPAGTTAGDVTVQVGTLTSNGIFFTTPGITVIPVTATIGTPADPVLASVNAGQNVQLLGAGFVAGATLDVPVIDQTGATGVTLVPLTNVSPDGMSANMIVPATATTGLWALTGSTLAGVPVQIIPTAASLGGTVTIGQPLDVLGSGFQEANTTVLFPGAVGPVAATDVLGNNDRLMVIVPPGVTGGTVTVTTPGGTSAGLSVGIAVLQAILATAEGGTPLDPGLPSANTGQLVTLQGLGLTAGLEATFTTTDDLGIQGTVNRAIVNVSADGTTAHVSVPISATTGLVQLGTGTAFLQIVPRLFSVETFPPGAVFEPGTLLTLTGTGLKQGATTVLFDGAGGPVPTSNVQFSNNTETLVTIPTGVTLVPPGNQTALTVTTDGGISESLPVSHPLLATITAVAPEGTPQVPTDPSAIIGQVVTVTGSGFTTQTRVVFQQFNATGAIVPQLSSPLSVQPDGTSLTVEVPIRAITNAVTVQDNNLAIGSGSVPVQIVPTINLNATGTLDPGSTLQLSGTGFDPTSTQVQFSGVATPVPADVAAILASNGTSTSVTVPSGVDPNGVLHIITPGGQSDPFDLTLLSGGQAEIEPNDTLATATLITNLVANGDPVTLDGTLNPAGDVDVYRVEVTQAPLGPFYDGEITLKDAQGPPLNVQVTVLAPDETTILFSGQATVDAVTPFIFDFSPTENGPHFIQIEEFTSQGSVNHAYQLAIFLGVPL